jgi:hypothetical protein
MIPGSGTRAVTAELHDRRASPIGTLATDAGFWLRRRSHRCSISRLLLLLHRSGTLKGPKRGAKVVWGWGWGRVVARHRWRR